MSSYYVLILAFVSYSPDVAITVNGFRVALQPAKSFIDNQNGNPAFTRVEVSNESRTRVVQAEEEIQRALKAQSYAHTVPCIASHMKPGCNFRDQISRSKVDVVAVWRWYMLKHQQELLTPEEQTKLQSWLKTNNKKGFDFEDIMLLVPAKRAEAVNNSYTRIVNAWMSFCYPRIPRTVGKFEEIVDTCAQSHFVVLEREFAKYSAEIETISECGQSDEPDVTEDMCLEGMECAHLRKKLAILNAIILTNYGVLSWFILPALIAADMGISATVYGILSCGPMMFVWNRLIPTVSQGHGCVILECAWNEEMEMCLPGGSRDFSHAKSPARYDYPWVGSKCVYNEARHESVAEKAKSLKWDPCDTKPCDATDFTANNGKGRIGPDGTNMYNCVMWLGVAKEDRFKYYQAKRIRR